MQGDLVGQSSTLRSAHITPPLYSVYTEVLPSHPSPSHTKPNTRLTCSFGSLFLLFPPSFHSPRCSTHYSPTTSHLRIHHGPSIYHSSLFRPPWRVSGVRSRPPLLHFEKQFQAPGSPLRLGARALQRLQSNLCQQSRDPGQQPAV